MEFCPNRKINAEIKGKFVPTNSMKEYRRSGATAPPIHNLDTNNRNKCSNSITLFSKVHISLYQCLQNSTSPNSAMCQYAAPRCTHFSHNSVDITNITFKQAVTQRVSDPKESCTEFSENPSVSY
jgi:hypothetical protein